MWQLRTKVGRLLTAVLLALTQTQVSSVPPQQDGGKNAPALRLRTDLVSLAVTVTRHDGSPVSNLERDDFEVYENNVRQEIEYFSNVDQPATVGIIFDCSGSMRHRFEPARAALKYFLAASHPADEYFLISFNDRIRAPMETGDGNDLLQQLKTLTPHGNTALYDAIYRALERLRESRNRRRALLIISDGADNHSRLGSNEIRQSLREADIAIYAIGSPESASSGCGRLCQFEATARLESLARISGGAAFFPHSVESLEKAVSHIAVELRRQYSLGYAPSTPQHAAGWRRIKVRVKTENLAAKVTVRAREGYYAVP